MLKIQGNLSVRPQRLQPMRKATDKINVIDKLHPYEPMKDLRKKEVVPQKLLAAAGCSGDDGNNKDKFFNKINKDFGKNINNRLEKINIFKKTPNA